MTVNENELIEPFTAYKINTNAVAFGDVVVVERFDPDSFNTTERGLVVAVKESLLLVITTEKLQRRIDACDIGKGLYKVRKLTILEDLAVKPETLQVIKTLVESEEAD